jgi:hypothetical protein
VFTSSTSSAATASTQSPPSSSSPSGAGNAQQAVSTTTTSTNAVGQSLTAVAERDQHLAPDESQMWDWDGLTETTNLPATKDSAQSTTTLLKKVAEEDPMSTPVGPAREPGSIHTLVEPTGPLPSPSNDEFDAALEQVSAIMRKGRVRWSRSIRAVHVDTTDSAPAVPSISALVGTAAVGAVGYRLVLRSPDDEKRRSWWYAHFPRI